MLRSRFIPMDFSAPTADGDRVVGRWSDVRRWVCCCRTSPFFMEVRSGDALSQVPRETQALFLQHSNGEYAMVLPLIDEPFRVSLWGREDNTLMAAAETGDPAVTGTACRGVYLIRGEDLYALTARAGEEVCAALGTCRPRKEKPQPEMADWFGWCTWDSFYEKVTAADVAAGLESFRQGGFVPKFLLLDDGWQSVRPDGAHRGEHKLCDFAPNEKFGGDLSETVRTAKEHYGVRLFYVWHALMGYWGGADPVSPAMAPYQIRLHTAAHSRIMALVNPDRCRSEAFPFGMPAPDKLAAFYDDYHRSLRAQGVDGVKIDVQAASEGHGHGAGGRVALARQIRQAMESSAARHFHGELLNCMSCANDHIFHTAHSNLMRSSNDFFPDQPLSHGQHVFTNAVVSLWMGEFTLCDWDMFQTRHPFGRVHAIARAVSGGPVYVSDRVDEHDFELIRRLTTADGRILRAQEPGRPTADTLFNDPTRRGLLKVFSRNAVGGVLAAFNLTDTVQSGSLSPSDVYGLAGERFALYNPETGEVQTCGRAERLPLTLPPMGAAVFTVMPMAAGCAPLGLAEKYNAGGAVTRFEVSENGIIVECRGEGDFLFCCEAPGVPLTLNGKVVEESACTQPAPGVWAVRL